MWFSVPHNHPRRARSSRRSSKKCYQRGGLWSANWGDRADRSEGTTRGCTAVVIFWGPKASSIFLSFADFLWSLQVRAKSTCQNLTFFLWIVSKLLWHFCFSNMKKGKKEILGRKVGSSVHCPEKKNTIIYLQEWKVKS